MEFYEILEMIMIISFGASWPLNVIKSFNLDYVSCSPYRVPIARLAAAQAQLQFPR